MAEYLIAFNEEWVPDHPGEQLQAKAEAVAVLMAEMRTAGVFVFTDGPLVESQERLGGFTVVEVADEAAARLWAGELAVACGRPQEVRLFQPRSPAPQTP